MGKTLHSAGGGRSKSHRRKAGPSKAEVAERNRLRKAARNRARDADEFEAAKRRRQANSESDVVVAALALTLDGR